MEKGRFYHIYNRGVNKAPIFFEPRNYRHFLSLFDKYLGQYVELYTYCLMPNHFHLLVKIKDSKERNDWKREAVFKKVSLENNEISIVFSTKLSRLDRAFRDFFISYAKSINKAYGRTGSLFQQGYKKKIVNSESYFSYLIQYIHNNPVEAGLCNKPEDWMYSSYNSIIKKVGDNEMTKYILDIFGGKVI